MLFNSLEFLFFFPFVVALYFSLAYKYRWILLLIASYYFYMSWNPSYIFLIITSTIVDYYAAIKIYKTEKKSIKKIFLYLSLAVNLGLLFFFKYFNFFTSSFNSFVEGFGIFPPIPGHSFLLPVGISFYTFQTLSYTIDVYKDKMKPEEHFGYFALYVSFFPQLVAGPIERASRLLPQFREKFNIDYERIKRGLLLILWGFFLKVVLADRLAEYVDIVYNTPEAFNGLQKFTATYFFIFQVYGDFAGYSYIAIGVALVMGYELMKNFDSPYLSVSYQNFWNRWHISLSSWILDYVFYPMSISKRHWGILGIAFCLMVTFFLNGLWHGADWNFAVFGFILGLYISIEFLLKGPRKKLRKRIGKAKFNFLGWVSVMVLWFFACIFFRINTLSEVVPFLSDIFDSSKYDSSNLNLFEYKIDFIISLLLIHIIWILEFLENRFGILDKIKSTPSIVKWNFAIILLMTIVFLGKFKSTAFIYFQF